MRRSGNRELSDERILGSDEFVKRIIKEAETKIKYQLPVKEHGVGLAEVAIRVGVSPQPFLKS